MDMENTQKGITAGLVGQSTLKNWQDLNDTEKIERMKEIIKNLSSSVSRLQSDLNYLRQQFKVHSHNGDKIVVPFNEYGGNNTIGIASLSNPNYF